MMMLQREKTLELALKGGIPLMVTYRIPTALDTEKYITKDTKNSELVKAFVTSVICDDVPELRTADDLLNLPGGTRVVSKIAYDIVEETVLEEDLKN